jgi:hypothetical protein
LEACPLKLKIITSASDSLAVYPLGTYPHLHCAFLGTLSCHVVLVSLAASIEFDRDFARNRSHTYTMHICGQRVSLGPSWRTTQVTLPPSIAKLL